MSFDKKLEAFIGPEGVSVIRKAVGHITDSADQEKYVNALQILPRAAMSWVYNITKSLDKGQTKEVKIPGLDFNLKITKNTPSKFSGSLGEASFENEILPNIGVSLLKSIDCLDLDIQEVNEKVEQEIQKAINFLVNRHLVPKVSVKLAKNELNARCPDCNENIRLSEDGNKLCICFKVMNRHLHLSKNTDGSYKCQFPSSWSKDQIVLLINTLKKNL